MSSTAEKKQIPRRVEGLYPPGSGASQAEGATGAEKRSEKFGCVELNAYLCTRKDGLS